MKLALVTWLDATRTDAEVSTADEELGVTRRTVGWLLRDDDAGVVLAMSQDGGSYERGFSIPRPYVVAVEPLRRRH